jgi:TPR repeat protein
VNYLKSLLHLLFVVTTLSSTNLYSSDNSKSDCELLDAQNCETHESDGLDFKEDLYYPAVERLAFVAMRLGILSKWTLSVAYEEGTFVKRSDEKAFKLFQSLANNGDKYGQYAVGYYYSYGLYVPKNYETAVAWLKFPANKGDAPSQTELARIYMADSFTGVNYDTAFYWASLAADQQYIEAYTVLAQLYADGKGVNQDLKESFRWWKLAADNGSLFAMLMVGNAYQHARGIERDYTQAVYWYRLASDQHYSDATYYLGLAYINGMGVIKNIDTGLSLINDAAEQENFIAQYRLGKIYLEGVNVLQDSVLAVQWFERAIVNGSSDSQVELALMHLNGNAVEQSVEKALELLTDATDQDSAYAAYILGRLYFDNLWVPIDYELALAWISKAAKLGNLNAMTSLVKIYTTNQTVGIDRAKAIYWLEYMQNSNDDEIKLNWASVAIETVKDNDISKAAFEYLLDAKSRDVSKAYGTLSWVYMSGVGESFDVPKDQMKAFNIAKEGAKRLDYGSFYTLGVLYEFGDSFIKKDPKLSSENYINALNLGSLSAKFRLGIYYLNNDNQERDQALSLIEDSAKEGLLEAYSFLGWVYENGYFVSRDIAIAKKFYRAAAEDLYADGQYRLSVLLRQSKDPVEQEEGISWLEKAAYGGHSEAQFDLSNHLFDEGSDESRIQAVEWARISAALGNPRGISMLAWLLGEGIGTLQDIKKSRELFKESANMGDPYSQYMFGKMMYEGDGIPKDIIAARELLIKACDAGNSEACRYIKGLGDIDQLLIAAKQGDSLAQFDLGIEYLYGASLKDIEKARHWLLSAAQQGHIDAQRSLGYLYAYELGDKPDYLEASKWFKLSAEQGNIDAQIDLGVLYEKGYGVTQSYTDARKWYELAVEQNSPIAQHNIGLLYAYGRGVKGNSSTAFDWFLKAAEQGYVRAQIDVGLAYEKGNGLDQNYVEARKWYEISAAKGSPIAQHNLGLLYASGRGVQIDERAAFELFYQSAQQGYPRAQVSLGFGFQNGKGVNIDKVKAIKWYRLAADQGNQYAKNNLWSMGIDVPSEKLCRPLNSEATGALCNIFRPERSQHQKFNKYLAQTLKLIMENYTAPKNDGLKYKGKVSFCFNKTGDLAQIALKQPSGHTPLDQAILKGVKLTKNITLPTDACTLKRISFLKTTLYYDESDMAN